jgi:hypothetical protein
MSLTCPERDLAHSLHQAPTPFLPYLLIALVRDHGHALFGDREAQAQISRSRIENEAVRGIGTGYVAGLALQTWIGPERKDMPTADVLTADLAAAALYVPISKCIALGPGARSGSILEGVETTLMPLGVGELFRSLWQMLGLGRGVRVLTASGLL